MSVTYDAQLAPLLAWWQAEIRAVLGEKIAAVLLGGSAALGDFQPGWSDVDVCVVLHDAVTEAEGAAIGRVHDAMCVRYLDAGQDGWRSGQAIEGAYVTAPMLRAARSGICYVAGGGTRRWGEADPIAPFDREIFARHGIVLCGEAMPIARPTRAALRAQSVRDVAHFAQPPAGCLHSAIWLAGIMHWLARSLVYWRDGALLSKTAALEREIAAAGPLASAYVLPLALRREGSAATHRHLDDLRRNYLAAVDPAVQALAAAGVTCDAEER